MVRVASREDEEAEERGDPEAGPGTVREVRPHLWSVSLPLWSVSLPPCPWSSLVSSSQIL